ncbi:MAG: leucine-rich repeat protein [Paludibacter sp.]|nr:leucine-rich repeat protein [Paludibacter sp.]
MKRFLLFLIITSISLNIWAQSFTINGIKYAITDTTNHYVSIGDGGSVAIDSYTIGVFTIPSSVNYKNVTYSVTSIAIYAFEDCRALTTVIIPNSVTYIGSLAFGYTKITSISIPTSVKSIGPEAFIECCGLTSVIIPASMDSIEYKLFSSCSGLKDITIPNSIKYIGEMAFEDCGSLSSVSIPSSVSSIGDMAFYYSGLKSITIPSSITSIGRSAFQCCPLISVTFANPSSLPAIGSDAFLGCTELNTINIPNSVSTIDDSAFYQCWGLTSVSIPTSVTTIGSEAFSYCGKLSSIDIPSSVTSIEYSAFYYCTGLNYIHMHSADPSKIKLGFDVFSNVPTSACILYVPTGSKYRYAAAPQWKNFTNIIEEGTTAFIFTSIYATNGGTVTGSGTYNYGSNCTLSAIPATGYIFSNWMEGGLVVSTSVNYTFTVSKERSLIANFVPGGNNYLVKAVNCTCRGISDGAINIAFYNQFDYTVNITSNNLSSTTTISILNTNYSLNGLPAGTYNIMITSREFSNYQQSFTVIITQPQDLSVLKVKSVDNIAQYSMHGGENYFVTVNHMTQTTSDSTITIPLQNGENRISIHTEKECQGIFEETIYFNGNSQITLFPNPTNEFIKIVIPGNEENVTVEIATLTGTIAIQESVAVPANRLITINATSLAIGNYIVRIPGVTQHGAIKMVKK